jgi:hypothetical protein
MNQAEQVYFEQFSGYKPTDDAWWDVWGILYSNDAFCHKECRSLDEAMAEVAHIRQTHPDMPLTIDHQERVGYGDMRLGGYSRYFPIKD